LPLAERFADESPNPEQIYAGTELRERVARKLAEISPLLRTAFWLREIEGLSAEEAAHALGVSRNTLKLDCASPARTAPAGVARHESAFSVFREHPARVPLPRRRVLRFPQPKRGPQERRDFRKFLPTRSLSSVPA